MICPVCKSEFKEGITVCPNCKVSLIDEAEMIKSNYVTVFQTDDSDLKEKIDVYLRSIGIDVNIKEEPLDDGNIYIVTVPSAKKAIALKEIRTITEVEAEKRFEEIANDPEKLKALQELQSQINNVRPNQAEYVKASTKYEEYRSSGMLFFVFGIILSIFTILNIAGVLKLFPQLMSCIVLLAFGVLFIAVGYFTYKRAEGFKDKIRQEAKEENELQAFLKTITKEEIEALNDDEDLHPEILYLKQTEYVKRRILTEFPSLQEEFVDEEVENFLNQIL